MQELPQYSTVHEALLYARAHEIAKEAGVFYPYLGNVRGHEYEDTYCPSCGERLIHRFGYRILRYRITDDKKCAKCGQSIPIRGR